jgi:Tfp pilus assembly protein PilF
MPVSALTLVQWGEQCLDRGDHQGALSSFNQALWLDANCGEAYLGRAVVYWQQKQWDLAEQDLHKCIELNPRDPRVYYYRGQLYRQTQAIIKAIGDYRQAIVLKPDWLMPYSPLAELLFAMGNYSELIPYLETLEKAGAVSDTLYLHLGTAYRHTNQTDRAIQYLQKVSHLESAQQELRELYRQKVMDWHFWMMNDQVRNDAYDRALRAVVTPDSVVLDIGTGSGLLAMQSARAGAKQVFTCEMEGVIAAIAQQIIDRNGYGDRIQIWNRDSTTLSVPADLPQRADILVTETFGSWLPSEGALNTISHARQHLLQPNAIIIPRRGVMYLALLECPEMYSRYRVDRASGFDLSLFNQIAPNPEPIFVGQIGQHPYRFLAEPLALPPIDFYICADRLPDQEYEITVAQDGYIHGLCSWFDLWLDRQIYLTTHPDRTQPHNAPCWGQWTKLLPHALKVQRGDRVSVKVTHDSCHMVVRA